MSNFRETLEALRKQSKFLMEEGRSIQNHYRRIEREYSDWEDRIVALDKKFHELELETGIATPELQKQMMQAAPDNYAKGSDDSILDDLLEKVDTSNTTAPKTTPSELQDLLGDILS